jgi:protoporphyrinogen oxidase
MSNEVVVIGGGISGLSFAYKMASLGKSVTVLEAKGQPGGCVRSEQFEDYWIELGAHTAYNSYGGFIEIIESTNRIDTLVPREPISFQRESSNRSSPVWGLSKRPCRCRRRCG